MAAGAQDPGGPGAPPDAPLTVVVSRTVRPGCEARYEAWLHGVIAAASSFPGHLGASVLRPHPGGRAYVLLFRFAGVEPLRAWEESPDRATWLARLEGLCEPGTAVQRLSGLEGWFQLPGSAPLPPPPRWKMALVTWLVAFPTIQLLGATLGPLLSGAHPILRGAVIGAVMVAAMTWVLMPRVTARLGRWLYRLP